METHRFEGVKAVADIGAEPSRPSGDWPCGAGDQGTAMARLKVFVSSDGLTDYVVAASSRPRALAAWGAHQDLFASGGAAETDDPALVKAALAQPGEVLRRAHAGVGPIRKSTPRPVPPKGPSPAALRRLERARAALNEVDAVYERETSRLDAAREALEAKAARATSEHEQARATAEQELAQAQKAVS
jgi:hypothetical protein